MYINILVIWKDNPIKKRKTDILLTQKKLPSLFRWKYLFVKLRFYNFPLRLLAIVFSAWLLLHFCYCTALNNAKSKSWKIKNNNAIIISQKKWLFGLEDIFNEIWCPKNQDTSVEWFLMSFWVALKKQSIAVIMLCESARPKLKKDARPKTLWLSLFSSIFRDILARPTYLF